MVKNTTSFGRVAVGICAASGAVTGRDTRRNRLASELLFIDLSGAGLFALRRRAGRKPERGSHRDPPAFGRLHEDSLGDTVRRRVLLRNGVAIGAVDDARPDRKDSQVSRDERVRPGRIPARAPVVEPELQTARTVPPKFAGVEIGSEIASAIAFVYRVDVFLEQTSRLDGIRCGCRKWRPARLGSRRAAGCREQRDEAR